MDLSEKSRRCTSRGPRQPLPNTSLVHPTTRRSFVSTNLARATTQQPFPSAGLARPISPCKRLENPDFAETSRQNSAQPQTTPRESPPNGRQTHFRVAPPFHVSNLSPVHNSVFYSRQIHPNFVFYRRQAILMSPTKPHMQARLSVCDCGT